MTPLEAIASLTQALEQADYLASREIATCAFLAEKLEKPILVEGPAGVGKTDLARALARATGSDLVRLQCYEGLDEAKSLYEWEYAKQLLYTQLLKDKIGETLADARDLDDAARRVAQSEAIFFNERFLLPRPLLRAILAERPTLLLIDEIDKADPEFEAFLLELLADYAVTIPELGTLEAKRRPRVILTSNNARELSDALKRRCLHLFIDFPDAERELAIIRKRLPGVNETLATQAIAALQKLRAMGLKKAPSISESLDWIKALTLLAVDKLDSKTISETLNLVLKHEEDIAQARGRLGELARGQSPKTRAE